MKVEWFNHTGIVVQDMEKMLEFYKGVLGLEEERNRVLEGPLADQLVGYEDARLHVIYLGNADMRHSVELVTYLNPPPGETMHTNERNTIGADTHRRHRRRPGRLVRGPDRQGDQVRQQAVPAGGRGVPVGVQGVLPARPRGQLAGVHRAAACASGGHRRLAPVG